jgi:uncharacterized protein (TIGR00369 family)
MRHHLHLLSASKHPQNNTSTASFSLFVAPELCNRTGMMHGGAVSMTIDMATTLAQAPLAAPGFWEFGGVSRTLSVTYLRPIPKGTEVLIVCEVLQVGKALGEYQFTSGRRMGFMGEVVVTDVNDDEADLFDTNSDDSSEDIQEGGYGFTVYRGA